VRVFASEADFDPATAEREFTVLISDYAITVLGPALAALLPEQTPRVRLQLHRVATSAVDSRRRYAPHHRCDGAAARVPVRPTLAAAVRRPVGVSRRRRQPRRQ
jgi:hypothetical protein